MTQLGDSPHSLHSPCAFMSPRALWAVPSAMRLKDWENGRLGMGAYNEAQQHPSGRGDVEQASRSPWRRLCALVALLKSKGLTVAQALVAAVPSVVGDFRNLFRRA